MEQKSKNTFYLDPDYENFIPREMQLKQSTVGANWGMTVLTLFFIVFCGFVGIAIISLASAKVWNYWRFSVKGSETGAIITACEDDADSNYPKITYVYMVDSVIYNTQYEVTRQYARCGQFQLNTQIPIQYYLNNPAQSRAIPPDLDMSSLFWMVLFVLANIFYLLPFCLMAVLFGIVSIVKARYQYSLLQSEGALLDGEVIKAEYKKKTVKNVDYFNLSVTARFKTPDGRLLKREFKGVTEYFISREIPLSGTPVQLLYANDHAVIML
jgi:hypothetical protein